MYRLQFFRTFQHNKKFTFRRDTGYGVYVNGMEFAIARVSNNEWDVTEVSSGLLVNVDHKTFPTRDSALAWLREYSEEGNLSQKLEKYSHIQEALAEYKKPMEVKTHEQVGDITLTIKQTDFLSKYKKRFGTKGVVIRDIAEAIGFSPMTVGALTSTLVEKGIFVTHVERGSKIAELTELGLEVIKEVQ